MKKFVCELGGYEILLHGNGTDAARAVIARAGEHEPIKMHGTNVQRAVDHMADWWRTGSMWWGPGVGREPTLRWFAAHKLDGSLKPERERELTTIVLAAMKEQGAL